MNTIHALKTAKPSKIDSSLASLARPGLLRVSIIAPVLDSRDAISQACRLQYQSLLRFRRSIGEPLELKIYAFQSDFADPGTIVVSRPDQIVVDSHFQASDLIIYQFGISYNLFDSIHAAPRRSKVVLAYYGITPPHLVPENQRSLIEDSYKQLENGLEADLAITISEFVSRDLMRHGFPADRIRRMLLPANAGLARLHKAHLETPGRDRPLRFLYVGRYVPSKGIMDLAEAFLLARKSSKVPMTLKYVGATRFSDSHTIDSLKRFISKNKLSGTVEATFDLSNEELRDSYDWADVVVIPSYHEGACVPVIEGYTRGCAVLCSNAAALPETSGGLALTFTPGEVEDIAARINELAEVRVDNLIASDRGVLSLDDWQERVDQHLDRYQPQQFEQDWLESLATALKSRSIAADSREFGQRRLEFHRGIDWRSAQAPDSPTVTRLRDLFGSLGTPHALGSSTTSLSHRPLVNGYHGQSPSPAPPAKGLRRIWHEVKVRGKKIPFLGKILVHGKRWLKSPWTTHHTRLEMHDFFYRVLNEQNRLAESLRREMALVSARSAQAASNFQHAQSGAVSSDWLEDRLAHIEANLHTIDSENREQLGGLKEVREGLWGLSSQVQGYTEMAKIIATKVQMVAMDVRERNATEADGVKQIEPRIIDQKAFERKVQEAGGKLRVNLGCGEKPIADRINVDFRELPGVDIVADIKQLPLKPGTVDEIQSAHLVEHFRQHQFQTIILPHWKSLLKSQGLLRIVCPNWEAMIQRLHQGLMSLDEFRMVTFGAQDYVGDDHFAMYTPQSLSTLLKTAGFEDIRVLSEDRMNGMCPELEIVARRP